MVADSHSMCEQFNPHLAAPIVATNGRAFIAVSDYEGLVDLLIACAQHLPERAGLSERFDKLWNERSFVLG